ncbi:MAG TPA: S8 family serine peptidase [Gammaproteobacteria bacterium]|nr:S8 family serine peptidase [Gammaproteobacteria bacterium]
MRALLRSLLLVGCLCAAVPSPAQIGLPRLPTGDLPLPLPPLPTADLPVPQPSQVVREANEEVQPVLSSVRARARELLARYPGQVERDPRGAPIVRAVILALSPDPQALQQAQARGFVIQSDQTLQPLGDRIVTLLVPPGVTTRRALRDLRAADPSGSYDFDHLFVTMQAVAAVPARAAGAPASAASLPPAVEIRVGLIDGGVDADHPVFATRRPQLSGCDGRPAASEHGTAVASLFVGRASEFRGAAPGAELMAVDVYCGGAEPGGRVRDIVVGLAALMAANVRVINMSVVGPDNAVLAAVIRKLIARSIVIVAASGNDGPHAGPLYPAAYPGVVAVTAVDAHAKVLMEASGGDYVRFAAPGADMLAASVGGKYAAVRGTSYASPLVAGLIARLLARDDSAGVEQVVQQLAATAENSVDRKRGRRHDYSLVGMELRTDPAQFDGRVAPD